MSAPLLAMAMALAVGLPIVALTERARGRQERRLGNQNTSPDRKDIS